MDKKLLNITELAKYTGIPKRTMYRMVQDGRFPVKPVTGLHPKRWYIGDVDEWMKGRGD